MNDYNPQLWNLNSFAESDDILINRTNNPPERYNRRLNELISAHPTMPIFVNAIKNDNWYYVQLLKDIQQRKIKPRRHQELVIPPIPVEYESFSVADIVEKPKKRLAVRAEK